MALKIFQIELALMRISYWNRGGLIIGGISIKSVILNGKDASIHNAI